MLKNNKLQNGDIKKGYFETALLMFIFAICYAFDLLILTVCTKGVFWKQFTSNSQTHIMSIFYIALLYISLITAGLIFGKYILKKSFADFFSGKNCFLQGLLSGIVIFSSFILLIFIPDFFVENIHQMSNENVILFLLENALACFAISFGEELIFRGIIFKTFERHTGELHAIIAVSALFALAHMFGQGSFFYKSVNFINLFLLSCFLCLGNISFKSLWFSIGAHAGLIYLFFIKNAFGFMKISPEYSNAFFGLSGNPMIGFFATIIFLLGIYIIRKNHETEKN